MVTWRSTIEQTYSAIRRMQAITPLAIVLLAVLCYLRSNPERLNSPGGYLDEYNYVSLFHNYSDPTYMSGAYKLARLPWIIPGYITYRCFTPRTANLVLHLSFALMGVGAFFFAVEKMFDRTTAALSTVALAFFPQFYGCGGWDYHNTAAGPYYLLAFGLLTVAAAKHHHRWLWFFLAGGALALAVHANISFVNMVPILIIHCYIVSRTHGQRTLAVPILSVIGGTLASTALLGVINVAMGRPFLFFMVLVKMVYRFVADPTHQKDWYHPWSTGWYRDAHYLVIPAAVVVGSVVTLILSRLVFRKGRSAPQTVALTLQVQYLIVVILWIGWQMCGHTALDFDYFAYPIYLPAFLALAGIIYLSGISERVNWPGCAAGFATFLWIIALIDGPQVHSVIYSYAFATAPFLGALVLAALAIVLLASRPPVVVSVFLALPVLALMNERVWGPLRAGFGENRETQHLAVVKAYQRIKAHDIHLSRSKLWFDTHERYIMPDQSQILVSNTGHSLAQMAAGYLCMPWPECPPPRTIPMDAIEGAARAKSIVVAVTNHRESSHELEQRFQEAHADVHRFADEVVTVNNYTICLSFFELSKTD